MGDVVSGVGSLLGGMSGSSGGDAIAASGAAMIAAGEDIIKYTDKYRKIVRRDTKKNRKKSYKAINSVLDIPQFEDLPFMRAKGVSEFIGEGNYISDNAYGKTTEQKREGLKFSLGGADDAMRDAQLDFAKLASGDTSGFQQEVKASAFGAIAEAAGMPLGTFANTSAKNMMQLRQFGTENALGITDFFAKQGTVDPVNPIDSIFGLAKFEQSENAREEGLMKFNRELDFNRLQANLESQLRKAGMKVDVEGRILEVLASMESHALDTYADALKFMAGGAGADELGQAQSLGSMGQAASQIGGLLGDGGGFLGGIFG